MGFRERAKWLWDRISDVSLARDLFSAIGNVALVKFGLSLFVGAGAGVMAYVQHLPAVIVLLSVMLGTAISLWLIDQALALSGRWSPAIAAAAPAPSGSKLSKAWGPVVMIGGVVLVAAIWQISSTKPEPSTAPPSKTEAGALDSSPPEVPPPRPAATSPVVAARAEPPRVVYVPVPAREPRVAPMPKAAKPEERDSEVQVGKVATPAAPATKTESPEENAAKARWRAIVNFMRIQRNKGDTLYLALRDTFFTSETLDHFERVGEWDRATADYVGDYSGPAARSAYLAANSVQEKSYPPDKALSAPLAKRRVELMNLIRSRQRFLGDIYSTNVSLPASGPSLPSQQGTGQETPR